MPTPRNPSPRRPRPTRDRGGSGADAVIAELSSLPIRRGAETWDVGLALLPTTVQDDEGSPFRPIVAMCASSSGGLAISDLFDPSELEPSCMLDAIGRFALKPLLRGAPPLGYLPAHVRVPTRRDPASDLVEEVLVSLGVSVQRTDELAHFIEAARSIGDFMEQGTSRSIPARGLMAAKGMTLDRVRGCAEAMAMYCAAAPWRTLDDEVQWRIEPAPATRALRTCIVTGALGEQIGLAFLASVQDFAAMHFLPEVAGVPYMPSTTVWSVMLQPLDSAPEADVDLWRREGLPLCELPPSTGSAAPAVASSTKRSRSDAPTPSTGRPDAEGPRRAGASPAGVPAIPFPLGITTGGRLLRPTPIQIDLMEALLRGFAGADRSALNGDSLRFSVRTAAGPQELTLRRS